MWMTDMVRAAKCQLRDVYGMTPRQGSLSGDPCFHDVPDGIYPMVFDDKTENVVIVGGRFWFGLPTMTPREARG